MACLLSKCLSSMMGKDSAKDLREKLKVYSARRHYSFANYQKKNYDGGFSKASKEEKAAEKVTPFNLRPGKEQLFEVVDTVSSSSQNSQSGNLENENKDSESSVRLPIKDCESSKEKFKIPTNLELASKYEPSTCDSQEMWMNSYIRKYRTIEKDFERGEPTTHMIARFAPKGVKKPVPANRYVEIEYKYNNTTEAEEFEIKGSLESLLPVQGENSTDSLSDDRIYQPDVDVFFNNLKYFINNLEGIVWWNGFNISAYGPPDSRLRIKNIDMVPGSLWVGLEGIKEIHVIRNTRRLELRAEDSRGKLKWFRIKGGHVSALKITGPKEGEFLIDFPEYPHCGKGLLSAVLFAKT